jgi:L-idonate 5-dehydrogenase
VRAGQRVAIHPGRNCGRCRACRDGRGNLCSNVFFMGSASRFPHMQGGFCDEVVVDESQCHPVSSDLPFTTAAFAEPLAVCLHAAARAGNLLGARVLVTGMGPIGQLVGLVVRRAGAEHITVTDVLDGPLDLARRLGADRALNVAAAPEALMEAAKSEGGFDVAFEVSGNPAGLAGCLHAVRPGGVVVQVGTLPSGSFPVAGNLVMAKEIDLRGAMRFDQEFVHAVACLDRGLIDVTPLLTASVPVEQAAEAFGLARRREEHAKVQILF